MRRIIVFTNTDKLSFREDFSDRLDVDLLSNEKKLLRFDENTSLFQVSANLLEGGLYFVLDMISSADFNQLVAGLDKSNFFILKHSEPANENFNFEDFAPNVIQGEHETNGNYYPDLVRIISDSDGDKLDRIIEDVFKYDPLREVNLNLLISLFPEKNPEYLDGLLEKHLQSVPDDVKSKTYNEKLTLLRMELLGS